MIGSAQFAFNQLKQHPGGLVVPLVRMENRNASALIGAEGKTAIVAVVPRIPDFNQVRLSVRHLDNTKKGFRAVSISVKNYSTGLWDLIGTATGERDDTDPDFKPFFALNGPPMEVAKVPEPSPADEDDDDWCPATLYMEHKWVSGKCQFCNQVGGQVESLNLPEDEDEEEEVFCPATLGAGHNYFCEHCGRFL